MSISLGISIFIPPLQLFGDGHDRFHGDPSSIFSQVVIVSKGGELILTMFLHVLHQSCNGRKELFRVP